MQPELNEVLRYLGAGTAPPEELRQQAEALSAQLSAEFQPRWVWKVFHIQAQDGGYFLPDASLLLEGHTARSMLADCHHVALLCCTLGAQFDALLRAAQVRDMARAVIVDAWGSAMAEAGCDAAQAELQARFPGEYTTDRFSPGYGDLPLTLQPQICSILDTPRRLGVLSTPSFLLNPSKSVTALIGLSRSPQMARVRGCVHCSLSETCSLRKGGNRCAL